MKILMIAPWFPTSRAKSMASQQGLFIMRQVLELNKRGNEFQIIAVRWADQPKLEIINKKTTVHRISPFFVFPQIRYPVPNLFSLSNKIKSLYLKWEPDIMIFAHIDYLIALPILWLHKNVKTPTVALIDSFPGISWFYGDRFVDYIGGLYSRFIMTRVIKRSSGVQLFAHRLLDDQKKLGIKFNNILVCAHGVDIALFTPGGDRSRIRESLSLNDKFTVILYVGRLDLVKGVEYLIEAAKSILATNKLIIFLIVGDGGLRKRFEYMAKPFQQNIIFMGWREDIPQLMRMADIFVLPSLSEGAPNVIMEASASGLPVVATNVGEISNIVLDGETGILVPPKNSSELAKALRVLIDDRETVTKMGQAGRYRIEKYYSWDTICNKSERFYNMLAKKHNK